MSKKALYSLLTFLLIAAAMLTACAPAATTTPEATDEASTDGGGETEALSVGIVLPTKDEPRWLQD